MKYLGSKKRHAKDILPIILEGRKPGQWYVEPFVGGGNVIDQVEAWTPEGTNGSPRMGSDVDKYIIALLMAVRDGWQPPDEISEEQYQAIKADPDSVPMYMAAFVMYGCSFGSVWGNGYGRQQAKGGQVGDANGLVGVADVTHRTLLRQAPFWRNTQFQCSDYRNLGIPKDAIVYCDPPYAGTKPYKNAPAFDHEAFWQWCDGLVYRGHRVFVSEYTAPAHWTHVWEKPVHNNLDKNAPAAADRDDRPKGMERLFLHRAHIDQGAGDMPREFYEECAS